MATDRERVNLLLDKVARLQRELTAAQATIAIITNGTAACMQTGIHMPEPPAEPVAPITPWETVLPPSPTRWRRFL